MADESHDCNEIANVPAGSSACKRKRAEETPMAEETRHLIRESRSNLMAEDCTAIANVPGSSSDPDFSMAEETHHLRDLITGVGRDVVTGNTIEGPRYALLNSTDG
ncbi:hypothetical protein M0R45_032518 [Rubus argutus]|uniref:Uncharacterized protein n=1 Tax=Rubus argutus TaxID=59490 RepID=A0AAW1WK16_RUBAR